MACSEPFLPGDEIDLPRSEARAICQGDSSDRAAGDPIMNVTDGD